MKPTAADVREQFDYDPETGELFRKRLRAANMRPESGSLTRDGYMVAGINGGHQLVHRLVWLWVHGDWPTKQIEHINGDRTDNRIANLRLRNPAPKSELTYERLKSLVVYEEETGVFRWLATTRATKAGEVAGGTRANGYVALTIDGVTFYAHRLAWLWKNGTWPKNHVDHINGDRADNRIANLRDVTVSHNSHNTQRLGPRNTTGYRGVAKYMDKYIAQMMVDGVSTAIGMFDTPEAAAEAYRKRHIEIFGEPPSNGNAKIYYQKSRKKSHPDDR